MVQLIAVVLVGAWFAWEFWKHYRATGGHRPRRLVIAVVCGIAGAFMGLGTGLVMGPYGGMPGTLLGFLFGFLLASNLLKTDAPEARRQPAASGSLSAPTRRRGIAVLFGFVGAFIGSGMGWGAGPLFAISAAAPGFVLFYLAASNWLKRDPPETVLRGHGYAATPLPALPQPAREASGATPAPKSANAGSWWLLLAVLVIVLALVVLQDHAPHSNSPVAPVAPRQVDAALPPATPAKHVRHKQTATPPPCEYKDVMTDAEIAACKGGGG